MNRSSALCRICGDQARGYNFGVISCMPCKAFFRRNALRPPGSLLCTKDSECLINKDNRGECSACRLQKCLLFGMKRDSIRTIRDEVETTIDWRNNLPLPQPIGLLRQDRSMMTMYEWTLISNLTHLYDQQNIFQCIGSMLQEQSAIPVKARLKVSSSVNIMMTSTTCVQNIVLQSQDIQSLSFPALHQLIKNNYVQVGGFNATLIDKNLQITTDRSLISNVGNLFGPYGTARVIRFLQRLDSNIMLLKILLFIMLFSSNFSIVRFDPNDGMQTGSASVELSQIQDKYVTILWKYMEYRFGYTETVLRFSSMVGSIVALYQLYEIVDEIEVFRYMLKEVATKMQNLVLPTT